MLKTLILALVCWGALAAAWADSPPTTVPTISPQQIHALAQHPYWRRLLRYQARGEQAHSQVKQQPHFFVSPEGEQNPEAELAATVQTWLSEKQPAPDSSLSCRFPRRIGWLREQLGISVAEHPKAACPTLETWLGALNPGQATLVFAADYINNPSSMFGHTLLRIDSPEQTEATRLLAYAVNYAANTNEANGLLFAYHGLTGGYPGTFSVMPYYEKVKEYNDMEDRDLWEYQLKLSPQELHDLLLHLWEMRGVSFPYYFLSSNCSYQLLGLIEAARPGLSLREDFPVYAIPTDTLRRVLQEQDILRAVTYRASSGSKLNQQVRRNRPVVNRAAKQLQNDDDIHAYALSRPEQAQALETGYDYLYHRFLAREVNAKEAPPRLRALLTQRAAIAEPDQRPAPLTPAVDPSQGHATRRATLSLGQDEGEPFIGLGFRPAYHDLMDPPAGYRRGAHIDFLQGEVRWEPEADRLKLQDFTLLAIDSLAAQHGFIQPLSWRLATGHKRYATDKTGRFSEDQRHGLGFVEGGAGISLQPREDWLCYGLLEADLQAGAALDRGWRVGLGPRLGCLAYATRQQWQLQAGSRYREELSAWQNRLDLAWQLNLSPGHALRLEAVIESENRQRLAQGQLRWLHYF